MRWVSPQSTMPKLYTSQGVTLANLLRVLLPLKDKIFKQLEYHGSFYHISLREVQEVQGPTNPRTVNQLRGG